jgi:DNA invertase Pin-like site-specific DNA recombinase
MRRPADLCNKPLHELTALSVGFVSLTEALDLTTPAGRAFAGFLAVFAEFERDLIRERIKAGITDARKRGKAHGRPRAKTNDAAAIRTLAQQGLSQAAIARHLDVHFISSLPVMQGNVYNAWADSKPVQMVWAGD